MSRKMLGGSLVACLFMLTGTGGGHAASLVTNGSFEDTTNFVDNTGQDTMRVPVGNSTAMPSWTVTGQPGRVNDIAWIGPTNPFGLAPASDGSYFLDLTGYQDGGPYGGVEQTIATVAGNLYSVTFDVGNQNGAPVTMTVSADTASQSFVANGFQASGTSSWTSFNYQFVALDASTLLSFIVTSSNGTIYAGLDNIAANDLGPSGAVPIPGALPLFASGLFGMGLFVRRRRKQTAA